MSDKDVKSDENKTICYSHHIDRRTFLKLAGATMGALALARYGFRPALGAIVPQTPLPGNKILQFKDSLPALNTIAAGASQIELQMSEFQYKMMPTGFVPAAGAYTGTYVWGYLQPGQTSIPSYIGPVILATRNLPTEVKYVNNLGLADPDAPISVGSKVLAYTQSTDQTLHWADPKGDMPSMPMGHYNGPIPAVPHLHGGEVPPQLDGGPDAWFTSDGSYVGHSYYTKVNKEVVSLPVLPDPVNYPPGTIVYNTSDSLIYVVDVSGSAWIRLKSNFAIYRYPNKQEAANIWFHDHTLGVTRLNVYAGLAGAYIIADASAGIPANLPSLIPLVIQDRMFDVNGQLYFPNLGINPMVHPFWIPEFVGDTIVVNGKVWPFQAVDRKRYRLLLLNGSNARFYDMFFIDPVSGVKGPRMWVIGTDGGYLDYPVLIDPNTTNKAVSKSLLIAPGERYEVIVDFNDPVWLALLTAAGVTFPLNLHLRNTAKTPFPAGSPAPLSTTGRIIQFQVSANAPADTSYNPATYTPGPPEQNPIRPAGKKIVRLVNPATGLPATGVTPAVTRQLTLNEVMGPGGPLEILVNNTKWSGHSVATDRFTSGLRPDFKAGPDGHTYYSELPNEGAIEQWEIINLTADAHPIHLHLVQFQLMNRQDFDVKGYLAAYNMAFPGSNVVVDPMTGVAGIPAGMYIPAFGPPLNYDTGKKNTALDTFSGPSLTSFKGGNPDVTPFLAQKKGVPIITPPIPFEAGWKDTVIMYPGQVTRILVRWAPTDITVGDTANEHFPFSPDGNSHGYVWHCHIIDHEDNEMMRPDQIQAKNVGRTYVKGTDY